MDSKTKHRILGVFVIVGLIIIMLPFLQSGRELSKEAVSVKAPPFPDQSVQVTAPQPAEDVKEEPDDTIKNDHPAPANPTSVAPPSIPNPVIEKVPETSPSPDDQPVEPTKPEADARAKSSYSTTKPAHVSKPSHKQARVEKHTKAMRPIAIRGPVDSNGLFKLQQASWVIQVGSYRSKTNALRVVNTLRAKGYRAFIQQLSSAQAENTRVFVGPENRQLQARELADQLESEMHMKGIVISYKPLAL